MAADCRGHLFNPTIEDGGKKRLSILGKSPYSTVTDFARFLG